MLNTNTIESHCQRKVFQIGLTIALGMMAANVYSAPLNAQTGTSSTTLENIEAGEEGWNFVSEDETRSIQNNLKELEDYSILNSDFDSDIRLIEEDPRWRKQGTRPNYPDYSLETEVYDY